jgi:hypothetical protein
MSLSVLRVFTETYLLTYFRVFFLSVLRVFVVRRWIVPGARASSEAAYRMDLQAVLCVFSDVLAVRKSL